MRILTLLILLGITVTCASDVIVSDIPNMEPESISDPIYRLEDLDVPPKPLSQVAPKLPEEIKQLLSNYREKHPRASVVILSFVITTEGKTENIEILKTGLKEVVPYMIEAVRQWRFEPGIIDGIPVNCRVVLPPPIGYTEPVAGGDATR